MRLIKPKLEPFGYETVYDRHKAYLLNPSDISADASLQQG